MAASGPWTLYPCGCRALAPATHPTIVTPGCPDHDTSLRPVVAHPAPGDVGPAGTMDAIKKSEAIDAAARLGIAHALLLLARHRPPGPIADQPQWVEDYRASLVTLRARIAEHGVLDLLP